MYIGIHFKTFNMLFDTQNVVCRMILMKAEKSTAKKANEEYGVRTEYVQTS